MTIKDVARLSGVSVSTVSRVLNNRKDVSAEARERVLSAIAELHYIPNTAARDLVRSEHESIGVVVRGAENPFFTSIIYAIEQSIEPTSYNISLHRISTTEDELEAAARLARTKRLKGLILLGGRFNYTEEEAAALDVPFVCCTFTNNFGTLDGGEYSSVSLNDKAEACRAVRMLTEKGHKRTAILLDSASNNSIGQLRFEGYLEALKESGIEPDPQLVLETGEFSMRAAYERVREFVRGGAEFTAIFAIADSLALAAMKALSDEGLSVPEDVSLAAIDGLELSLYSIPMLTTYAQPQAELGSEAVKILLEVIDGKPHRHLSLPASLREGGTVRNIQAGF